MLYSASCADRIEKADAHYTAFSPRSLTGSSTWAADVDPGSDMFEQNT